jgi:hypothetical protein
VIVDNRHVIGIAIQPSEDDSPLIVDARPGGKWPAQPALAGSDHRAQIMDDSLSWPIIMCRLRAEVGYDRPPWRSRSSVHVPNIWSALSGDTAVAVPWSLPLRYRPRYVTTV